MGIHPITMDVPPAFEALAKTRGQDIPGAIPSDTVVLFALGGYAYSSKIKPWPWLESKEAAEAMAERVAEWPEKYNIDGIDLDLEKWAKYRTGRFGRINGLPRNPSFELCQKLRACQ